MYELLMRKTYDDLTTEEKQHLLMQLAEQYHLQYQRMETFSCWGKTTETAVYTYQGSEFVFVPGDSVTLGWDGFTEGMDALTCAEIQAMLDEYEIKDTIEEFLRSMTTPVRQVTVGPMLVERRQQEIGWEPVSFDDPRLLEDPVWMEKFAAYRQECQRQEGMLEFVGQVRFQKLGEDWQAAIYHNVTHRELKEQLAQQGFWLPTVDEWEYLCGGGCRTLFAWGDSFLKEFCLRHFEDTRQQNPVYTLEQPNFFGLTIGFDPYRREIVEDAALLFKGGDGGCNVCGGMGIVLGYLPCTPYFALVEEEDRDDLLNGDFDFLRRIIRIQV